MVVDKQVARAPQGMNTLIVPTAVFNIIYPKTTMPL